MSGIVSYGYYIPSFRITIKEIADMWNKKALSIQKSLNMHEKAVSGIDEDSLTMAYESACHALLDVKIKRSKIKALFFGTESPSYAVNPSSTILGDLLGLDNNYLAYDTQFACKAATGAIISSIGLLKSNMAEYVLVCASDKATAKPHDALEYTAASGSVTLLLGKTDIILEIVDFESFSTDTPDFWRREGIRYPSHGGRFTGKPSYFYHIEKSTQSLLKKQKLHPEDFKHAVFHMPNGKYPIQIAQSLGFKKSQIEKSLIVSYLGNSYTASSLMGLMSVLETACEGDLIFLASYGSGAGSDAFVLKVTKNLKKRRRDFKSKLKDKKYINYTTYLKYMNAV